MSTVSVISMVRIHFLPLMLYFTGRTWIGSMNITALMHAKLRLTVIFQKNHPVISDTF